MLGYSHAISGALAFTATAPLLASATGHTLDVPTLAAGTLATAGAALLPDLDHPSASIAQTFGPLSRRLAKLTSLLAGGHRQGTHSLLFAAGTGAVIAATVLLADTWPWLPLAVFYVLAAFAIRALDLTPTNKGGLIKTLATLAVAAAATWLATDLITDWWWLPWAVAGGCVVHLLGDTLTPEGVPWLHPARVRWSVPLIAHTGNVLEKAFIAPAMTIALVVLLGHQLFTALDG